MRYKTIASAAKASLAKEISLRTLISGSFYHKKRGWSNLSITDVDLDGFRDVIGRGKYDYGELALNYTGRNYTVFDRFVYRPPKGWMYIAGQDYSAELNVIRKILRTE